MQSVASCAMASAAGGSAQMTVEQLYSNTLWTDNYMHIVISDNCI